MSDGDRPESSRAREDVAEEITPAVMRAGANDFGRAIARIAVAQICQSMGFESVSESALDSLLDIAIRYLCDLGKTSSSYANSAGRTECNVFDVIQGMEDLGLLRGFSGAGEACPCILSSGAVQEVIEYVDSVEEVPFAQPVPHFPVPRARKPIPSFSQLGETPGFKHIPDWLPAFPDPHTYIHTPVWNERATDPRTDKIELARQRRKAERSLLSLQQRLVSNGAASASTSSLPHDIMVENVGSVNPFLSKPLHAGEKDVSSIALPAKLIDDGLREATVSLLEAFAPAIEAMKDAPSKSGSHEESNLPERRCAVRLEFKTGKRVLGHSLDLRLKNRAFGKMAPWFGQNDEKDDKKRRAEFILRQSMENQQDLTQL